MSTFPESFEAQINQGVPGPVKTRPDLLPAGAVNSTRQQEISLFV